MALTESEYESWSCGSVDLAVVNNIIFWERNPKSLMHFLTLALLHLSPLAILAHLAIIPPKSIGIGAISHTHDVDTSKVAH